MAKAYKKDLIESARRQAGVLKLQQEACLNDPACIKKKGGKLYTRNLFFKITNKNLDSIRENLSIRNLFIFTIVAANFFIVWSISFEITSVFDSNIFDFDNDTKSYAKALGLTIFWGIYAGILLIIGISKRSYQIRSAAIFLLAIPVAKLFVYDTFNLEQIYRIISYVFLGILLIIGGFMYQKYEDRIKEFILKD